MRLFFFLCAFTAWSSSGASADAFKVVASQKGGWDATVVEFGVRNGYFKQEGLDVDILYASGGGEPLQALIAGSVDISVSTGLIATMAMISKEAPLKIISAAFTGTTDSYWYVRKDSPVQSLKDTDGKTVAFTGVGSSSQLVITNLLKQYNVTKARPIPAGNPTLIYTSVMSGQIDVGFSLAPMNVKAVESGAIRIIARGGELQQMKDQTTRVNVVTTQGLEKKGDALRRFMRALNRTLDFMYGDVKALEWYGAMHDLTVDQTRRSRDMFHPRESMQTGYPKNLALTLEQAKESKYVPKDFTLAQVESHIQIIDGN